MIDADVTDTAPRVRRATPDGGRRVLNDDAADAELARTGVAVVPLLDPATVEDLTQAYLGVAPRDDHGLVVDYMRPDRGLVRELAGLLTDLWRRHLDDLAFEHRVVMSTFVVKHPGAASEMFLHDDRSYVDEREHRASTIWVPLVDVGPDLPNGGLQVVPRSHLLPTGFSGSNTPDLIRPWEPDLRRALVDIDASAGSAVVYDTRVLHASRPNLGTGPRIAVVCAIAPKEAPLLHVVATGRRTRRLHRVDDEFFLDHHPREIERRMPDDCPVIEELREEPQLAPDDIAAVTGVAAGEPVVPVPLDLVDGVGAPSGALEGRPAPRLGHVEDLTVDPATLAGGAGVPTLRADRAEGAVGIGALVRRFRRSRAPEQLSGWRGLLGSRCPRDVDVVVLEPGARLRATAPRTPRWSTEAVVVEAPTVGAGVRAGDAAAAFDLGVAVSLPQAEPLEIWNDGPGQLVLLVARVPDRADRIGRVLDSLGSRRPAGAGEAA